MNSTITRSRGARHNRTRRVLMGLSFVLAMSTGALHAAEADTAAESPDDAETASSEPVADKPASEVFIPTEEISEDFAVSFPVDI